KRKNLQAADQSAATMTGCEVGASTPPARSSVTAMAPVVASEIVVRCKCKAVPSSLDANRPAGAGLPPLGIIHISYIFLAGVAGRFEATSSTLEDLLITTRPRGGAGLPSPKVTSRVSGACSRLSASR